MYAHCLQCLHSAHTVRSSRFLRPSCEEVFSAQRRVVQPFRLFSGTSLFHICSLTVAYMSSDDGQYGWTRLHPGMEVPYLFWAPGGHIRNSRFQHAAFFDSEFVIRGAEMQGTVCISGFYCMLPGGPWQECGCNVICCLNLFRGCIFFRSQKNWVFVALFTIFRIAVDFLREPSKLLVYFHVFWYVLYLF